MAKYHLAVGLAAWALFLAPTAVSAGTLEKYQTLGRPPLHDSPRLFPVPKQAPSKKDDRPSARLFGSFEERVKALPSEEKNKLLETMREKQKSAYANNDYPKGRYYGQLVDIILRNLGTSSQ